MQRDERSKRPRIDSAHQPSPPRQPSSDSGSVSSPQWEELEDEEPSVFSPAEAERAASYEAEWFKIVSPTQLKRFEALKNRKVERTRLLHLPTLKDFGVLDDFFLLTEGIGFPRSFWQLNLPTYIEPTLEFLSSLTRIYDFNRAESGIRFRLLNKTHDVSSTMLREWFGFPPYKLHQNCPFCNCPLHFWKMIAGHFVESRDFQVFLIQHPALRVTHRILASTINARGETNRVTESELDLINIMLHPDKFRLPDFACVIVSHWFKLADTSSGAVAIAITMGMYVTFIAQKLGLDLEPTSTQANSPLNNNLDHAAFRNFGFIEVTRGMAGQRDTYKWKLEGMLPIDLPYYRLDFGNPNTWLIEPRCKPAAIEPDLAGHEEAGEETVQGEYIPKPMQTGKNSHQPPPQLPHQLQDGQYYHMPPAAWYTDMHNTMTSMQDMIQEIRQTSMNNSAQLDECRRRIGNIEKQLSNHCHYSE